MTYQIPPDVTHFVNRADEQAQVFRAADGWDGQTRPLCVVLSGPGGTGKSELAFRIARTQRDRYRAGVLYVDLDDLRRDGAVEVSDALGELLPALGVTPEWQAPSLAARSKQYWDRTDGKELIVIVDNARYAAEVVPLLPASGCGLVLVTSHGPLHDLTDARTVELPLGPLGDQHALELLRSVVDDPRLADEPEAAAGLLRLCSGLPAALHVAGRLMRRHRRRPLARLLTQLTSEIHDKGLPEVEQVWDVAYRELNAPAAELYRLLAVFPAATITPHAATALLGRGPDAGDDALEELEASGLLDGREPRLRLPELLKAHARRRASQDGGEAERTAALHRLIRWYLRQAQRADLTAAGRRLTLAEPVPAVPDCPDLVFNDPEAPPSATTASGPQAVRRALRWLDTERHALYGCVRAAHQLELHNEAWALCEPLWTHFLDHPHYTDTTDAFRTGVAAAQRAEHLPALVRMRCQLARPLWEQQRYDDASQQLTHALSAAATLGETPAERKLAASAIEFRGMLRSAQADWAAAAADFDTARTQHQAAGNDYGTTLQTYRWGEAMAELGHLQEAAEALRHSHRTFTELHRERLTARAALALAQVLRRQGQLTEAQPLLDQALASARNRGSEREECRVLEAMATLAADSGSPAEAAQLSAAAHAIKERNGAP